MGGGGGGRLTAKHKHINSQLELAELMSVVSMPITRITRQEVLNKQINWCLTPSQPVRLYQSEGKR